MRMIGVDPGPSETAWVLLEGGEIKAFGKEANEHLNVQFFRSHSPHRIAIEMVQSFGMAVGAEVFETVYWIGRFAERAGQAGEVERVFRKDVKMHLCNSMRAKDPNIRQALIDKMGPPGTKKNPGPTYGISGDCWSALAVAVTAIETRKTG